jgi:hypothetical protein
MNGLRIRRFIALRAADRRLLIQAAAGQILIRMALAMAGYAQCRRALSTLAGNPRVMSSGDALDEARHVARLVRSAGVHGLLDPNCLTQSLTIWWLLRSRGIASEICIGVRKRDKSLEAHAWVEHQGMALDEHHEPGRFVPFAGSGISLRRTG